MHSERAAKFFGDREDPRRRLVELFGGTMPEGGQPPESALQWAAAVSSPDHDEVAVVLSRQAVPALLPARDVAQPTRQVVEVVAAVDRPARAVRHREVVLEGRVWRNDAVRPADPAA